MIVKQRGEIHLAVAMYKNRPKNHKIRGLCSIGKLAKILVFMRLSGGLLYYNAFLNTAYNTCGFHISISFSAAHLEGSPCQGSCQPNRLTEG